MCVRYLRFSKILKLILLSLLINLIFVSVCFGYQWVEGANPVDPDELLNYITKNAWGYDDITDNSNNIWNTTEHYNSFMNNYNTWVGAHLAIK